MGGSGRHNDSVFRQHSPQAVIDTSRPVAAGIFNRVLSELLSEAAASEWLEATHNVRFDAAKPSEYRADGHPWFLQQLLTPPPE